MTFSILSQKCPLTLPRRDHPARRRQCTSGPGDHQSLSLSIRDIKTSWLKIKPLIFVFKAHRKTCACHSWRRKQPPASQVYSLFWKQWPSDNYQTDINIHITGQKVGIFQKSLMFFCSPVLHVFDKEKYSKLLWNNIII